MGIRKVSNSKSDLCMYVYSNSLIFMPFDRSYMISYWSFIVTMSVLGSREHNHPFGGDILKVNNLPYLIPNFDDSNFSHS